MNAESDASAPAMRGSLLEGVLAESGERYASLFTHHPHATYSVDRNGYYTDANPRALAMTGLTLEQMRETHFALVIHPEDVHIIKEGFERALTGEPNLAEARVLHVDNQVIDIRCTMIPAVVDGEIIGVHGVTEDITEAKQVLRQLEEANSAKARFLANTSHEIRTPLASIIGVIELLMDAELATELEHFVHVAHRNSHRLAQLVDGILDYSRLQAHQIVLHPKPISIREIVDGISEWAVSSASARDLTISFIVDETVPMTVVGDGLRISQVVTNLVQNAIKFTKSGGVAVRVGSRIEAPLPHGATENPDIWVDFTVSDTGIGIADDDVQTIFEPFTQTDPSDTRDHEGLGLGLTICRDLVDLMGGLLHFSSKIGEGTTFTFSVPLDHFEGPCPPAQGRAAGMPLTPGDDPPDPEADTVANLSVNARGPFLIDRLQAGGEGVGASGVEWRDVVETLPQIVWITRPDGYHVYFNQHWMDFTGLSLEESLGDGWNPPFHPADRPLARRLWDKATHTGQPYEIEYRLRRHDGVYRWMLGRALPLRNTTGEIMNWFGTCTDISELKAALQGAAEMRKILELRAAELEIANTELARANAQFSDLVSMVSHDVRQPLVAIKGFSELMLDDWSELSEEQRLNFVIRIARAGETAEQMLEDTLNTTALQGGAVIPQPAPVFVVDAARSAAKQVATDLGHLTVSGPENLAAHVDPGHFAQVLINLLTNAVKYGAPPITISCAQDGADHVTVRVTDQGEGVPADFVPQLFDRYTRADSARSGAQKGTGLGLFIVRRLLEANGGTIDYQPPTPSAGGFVVTLPAVRAF